MQITHNQPIPQPNIQVFEAMKAGIDITTILPNATTFEYYFYIKAYSLVDNVAFINYCQLHKGSEYGRSNPNISTFLSMLYGVLDEHFPPLNYGHKQQDGYIGLDDYVELAKGVFQ